MLIRPMFGHFCSIITALIVVPDGTGVVTCDRDGVARLSALPEHPGEESYVIKHFFMGHTKFISSASLACWNGTQVLVTAGGDGLVLCFDIETGRTIGRFDLQPSLAEMNMTDTPVVVSVAAFYSK